MRLRCRDSLLKPYLGFGSLASMLHNSKLLFLSASWTPGTVPPKMSESDLATERGTIILTLCNKIEAVCRALSHAGFPSIFSDMCAQEAEQSVMQGQRSSAKDQEKCGYFSLFRNDD